jgi:ribosomal protein L7Ae-like RNA K-turn-binding protein
MRQALKPGKLAAALKQPVNVSSVDGLCQSVILLLRTRLGSYLSMAQKAGAAISGATPLHKALAQRHVRYMVLAEDIAVTRAEVYHGWCRQQSIPWLTLFSKDELGQLLGKPERSAVGLTDRRFGEPLHATANTLLRLQADSECTEAPCNRALSSSL